jgi:hypothetical protein
MRRFAAASAVAVTALTFRVRRPSGGGTTIELTVRW